MAAHKSVFSHMKKVKNIINTCVPAEYHILKDKSTQGTERPWQEKKINSMLLSKSYDRLGYTSKANRLRECGNFLEFKKYISDNTIKLSAANFCRIRLCPMCSWRRSLKIFGQVSRVMNEAVKQEEYNYLFLTLTVKNCVGDELFKLLDLMMKGYKYIFERTKVKKLILGAFRALEITHNKNSHSKSFDTYHPHFHCILMVRKSYFNGKSNSYITQKEWADMWKHSINSDYDPIVHIEKIDGSKKNIEKAVAEVAKYSVKDSDILYSDEHLQDNAVMVLDSALSGRRLISFRGEFAKIQKRLKLDDAIDGDLINCDCEDEKLREDVEFVLERYRWHVGYFQYLRLDDTNEFEREIN